MQQIPSRNIRIYNLFHKVDEYCLLFPLSTLIEYNMPYFSNK